MPNHAGKASKNSLIHAIRPRQLFSLSFGTIIGIGWIMILGFWLSAAGSIGTVIALVGGGGLMLIVGRCYAEVASMFPIAGGEVVYAYKIDGIAWCFAMGWALALLYTVTTSFEAIGVGWVLGQLLPGSEGAPIFRVLGEDVFIGSLAIQLAIMGGLVFIHCRGIKIIAMFQDAMTFGLVLVSAAFISFGIVKGDVVNLSPYFVRDQTGDILPAILAIMATTPYWFAGFNTIPQAMSEISDDMPLRLLDRVILGAIIAAFTFYVLVVISGAMLMPRDELLMLDMPTANAFEVAFDSPAMTKAVLVAGLFGLITTWNAVLFAASRVVFTLARLRFLPPLFARVSSKYSTPTGAVIFVGVVGSIGMMFGKGSLVPIVEAMGILAAFIFAYVCIGMLRLRRSSPDIERPCRAPHGILLSSLGGIAMLGLGVMGLYQAYSHAVAPVPMEWAVLISWSILGAIFWRLTRKYRNGLEGVQQTGKESFDIVGKKSLQ